LASPRLAALLAIAGILLTTPAVRAQTARPPSVKPHAGMMRYPAVSATQIAFVYAGKIWLAPREGGLAYPCASPTGNAAYPRFSPDGTTLAFTANYDGNYDLYTIPTEGGNPIRATYHPGADVLCGWTPDGKLLFTNNAMGGIGRFSTLQTVPTTGGLATPLPIPYGEDAAISPDGRYLAYTPSSTNNRTWKRYRGGWAQDIWLFDLKDKSAKRITTWEGTDTLPMWQGEKIYYLSDGGPEHRLNLWVFDTKSGKRDQVTKYTDFDVKWPSIGPGAIVFQHGAELRLLDLKTQESKAIDVRVPGDRPNLRPRAVDSSRFITHWSISPSAKRVAVAARGDIWTVPAKDGTPRSLTRTSGAHETDPLWSPNGRWIAYLSDVTGEYELYLAPSDGKGETRQLTKGGNAYRYMRNWSPDSKNILFVDKTGALYLCSADTGQTKRVDTDPMGNAIGGNWSPDSRYLVYTRSASPRSMSTIWIYDTQTGEKRQVTSGMFNDTDPVFDRKGDYLFYASSRVFSRPLYDDVQQSWIYNGTQTLVGVPLRANVTSPFAPKSDEETGEKKDDKPADEKKSTAVTLDTGTTSESDAVAAQQDDGVSGEWTGMVSPGPNGDVSLKMTLKLTGGAITGTVEAQGFGSGSIAGSYDVASKDVTLTITVPGAPAITFRGKINGNSLTATGEAQGMTITLTATRSVPTTASTPPVKAPGESKEAPSKETKPSVKVTIGFDGLEARTFPIPVKQGNLGGLSVNAQNQLLFVRGAQDGPPDIKVFDLNDAKREEKTVAAGAGGYDMTPDGKKILVFTGGAAKIQDATAGATAEPVPTSGMMAMIDPREEWREIFDEAWRIERDFFYDPNMHGVDWKAVHDAYAKMLADCNSRSDVGYVIGEMISELNVGHAYYGGGDLPPEPAVSVGMLGADFALENGTYRIKKIYRGAPWDTDAVGPLSEPGVKVKEGDYLLAVNGVPVDTSKDPWAAFQGLADRTVTLTVSAKPAMDKDARDGIVRLLGSEGNVRYRAWIEKNRAYVDKVTGGKVGYIYVPDTGTGGQGDLVRQFVGQMDKAALIIDERWNGGGQIPTRFIEMLNRPTTNYWARRDGQDWPWPPDAHNGPKCMLINGLAGSGGDAFPWYFRQAGIGKLIGTRTWGGLVGLSGNPPLIDGAVVTAPTFAFYKKNGTWGIEGHGVDPDIEVLDDPSKMQNGADPQLDAAIRQMLDEIKSHPYLPPHRPPYPDRSKMGIEKKDI
jgi:tricorn protease